jgi:hypothetical protein
VRHVKSKKILKTHNISTSALFPGFYKCLTQNIQFKWQVQVESAMSHIISICRLITKKAKLLAKINATDSLEISLRSFITTSLEGDIIELFSHR